MLVHLSIKDLAVVHSAHFELGGGLNIITGETGSGKSVMIKALSLLLGGRASADLIRTGADSASVSGVFEVPKDHPALLSAQRLGIPLDANSGRLSFSMRRMLSTKGRSQSYINDVPVTSQTLSSFSSSLLDIFGQHENHTLLDSSRHGLYVDAHLEDSHCLGDYQRLYVQVEGDLDDFKVFLEQYHNRQREEDYLRYRFDEMQNLEPSVEDFESWEQLQEHAKSSLKCQQALTEISVLIDGDDQSPSLVSQARKALRMVQSLDLPASLQQKLLEHLQQASEALDQASFEVSKISTADQEQEARLEEVEDRLSLYYEAMRKLNARDINQLMDEYKHLREAIEFLDAAPTALAQMLSQLLVEVAELQRLALILSEQRMNCCRQLSQEVHAQLADLGMKDARFEIRREPIKRSAEVTTIQSQQHNLDQQWSKFQSAFALLGPNGSEKMSFYLAANPGESLQALEKVASGGEISRIMLALKAALSAGAFTCVMVFDEIDTGISGRIADMVGRKLMHLSKSFQVLCISHLPQVAVYANHHYSVRKHLKGERTESQIWPLKGKEAVEEIAQLLSGDSITALALANAEELIQHAQGMKKRRGPKGPVSKVVG